MSSINNVWHFMLWHSQIWTHCCLHIASGKTFTEVEVDELLTSRRAAQPGFVEPSFVTIAGASLLPFFPDHACELDCVFLSPALPPSQVCAHHLTSLIMLVLVHVYLSPPFP